MVKLNGLFGYLPAVPLNYIVQISLLAFLLGGKPPLTASPAALVFPPRHLPFLRLRLKGMRSLKNPRRGPVFHALGKKPALPLDRQVWHGERRNLGQIGARRRRMVADFRQTQFAGSFFISLIFSKNKSKSLFKLASSLARKISYSFSAFCMVKPFWIYSCKRRVAQRRKRTATSD